MIEVKRTERGWAGHFCCSYDCRFRRNTLLEYNGTEWLHVSFSRKSRIPDYKDIQLVRKDFIGTDKKSIMVFPNEEHYVNIAKYCLHLWYSADNPIPDFDCEIGGIRSI